MKINFTTILNGLDGQPLKIEGGKSLTLGKAATEAVMAPSQDNAEGKMRAYNLGKKLTGAEELDLEPEDVVFIKDKIAAVYGPTVVGPAFDILNG